MRKGQHTKTPERVARARELRDAGWLLREIAKEMGVGKGAIHGWLSEPRAQTYCPPTPCACGCGEMSQGEYRRGHRPPDKRAKHDGLKAFWARVDQEGHPGGCWIWLGAPNAGGYGKHKFNGRYTLVHRTSYELHHGPIPPGLVIDHLCRNTMCVNPDHLEAVTDRVNVLRGIGATARNARKTHCKHGHEFTPENTYIRRTKYGAERHCRTCVRARQASYQARRAAQAQQTLQS